MSEHEHYTSGTWHGKTQYRCTSCKFKTLDEQAMQAHVSQAHQARLRVRPAAGELVTERGEAMHVVEEEPAAEPARSDWRMRPPAEG